jgi:nonsense-mediated mRNA decay protein 3
MAVTVAEVSSTIFWRYPFDSICDPKQLTEYIVMDIDHILDKDRKTFPGQGAVSSKVFFYICTSKHEEVQVHVEPVEMNKIPILQHVLADVWVVKASELGLSENTIHSRTHLGHILKPGDSALG